MTCESFVKMCHFCEATIQHGDPLARVAVCASPACRESWEVAKLEASWATRRAVVYVGQCVVCAAPFNSRRGQVNTCSEPCRVARVRELDKKNTALKSARRISQPRQTACAVCGVAFGVQQGGKKYCGSACGRVAEGQRKAASKKRAREAQRAEKAPRVRRIPIDAPGLNRSERRAAAKRQREDAFWESKRVAPPSASEIAASLPCANCAHWEALEGADMGGQCVIGRWAACKPLVRGSVAFAPKGVTRG